MPKPTHGTYQRLLKAVRSEIEKLDRKLDKLIEAIPQIKCHLPFSIYLKVVSFLLFLPLQLRDQPT